MTQTQAIKQAVSESSIYRFGGQWVFVVWDAERRLNRESAPMSYHAALRRLIIQRHHTALVLLGWDYEDADWESERTADGYQMRDGMWVEGGSLRERVSWSEKLRQDRRSA